MKLIVDEELRDIITEEWIRKILSVIPSEMLEGLTLRIIEPHWKPLTIKEISTTWDVEELSERLRWASSPEHKVALVKVRKEAWNYYTTRREVARAIYHEIYHANDKEDIAVPRNKKVPLNEYWNHPREVRARTFAEKMLR